MKIAIVSINLEVQSGGNRQILILAKNLQKTGNKVTVYAVGMNQGAFSDIQKELDVKIIPAGKGLEWKDLRAGFIAKVSIKTRHYLEERTAARRIAEAMDPDFDAVNCHDYAYQVGYFYKKRNPLARVIWTMNEPPYIHLKKEGMLSNVASELHNCLMDFTERKFMRAIDAGAVLARFSQEWLSKRGIKSSIVRSGVDFDDFYSPVKRLPADFSKEPLRLLTVGTPNKYRRYEDAIEAVRVLRESKGINARLTIIANNVWREDEYCAMLKKRVEDAKLEEYISLRFEGVPEDELRRAYREGHMFLHQLHVSPIKSGSTQGLVVWEAMAAGLLVVASHDEVIGSPLTDGKNAVFVKPENAADLAEKIAEIAGHPERYFEIASAGQSFVKTNNSWEIYTNEMLELFKK